jgi:hypothetical protein
MASISMDAAISQRPIRGCIFVSLQIPASPFADDRSEPLPRCGDDLGELTTSLRQRSIRGRERFV